MKVATRLLLTSTLITLVCCGAVAQGNSDAETVPLKRIVDGLEQTQTGTHSPVPYQIVREYRLSGSKDSRSNSQVVAEVDFRPPNSKDYRIQKSEGSGRGLQVVRRVLDHEVAAAINQGPTRLTRENYDFSYIGKATLDGQLYNILGLSPKRKEADLITGQVWVDDHSFVVRQIEGELAKSPSWWIRKVSVKLTFSELDGAWLQTGAEATADVRIAGQHTLTSRTLDYRPGNDLAAADSNLRPTAHVP
jgi:hypothetical protein